MFSGFAIGINLPCYKKEVVANTVQHDCEVKQPFAGSIAVAEANEADDPCDQTYYQHPFHTKTRECKGNQQHKYDFRSLA
ncbi:hypothetical protein D3C87_1956780 [compost metagenome]